MTTWGSKNAEDLFEIATRCAGFDPGELMIEIHRRTLKTNTVRVNSATVAAAMQTLFDRDGSLATTTAPTKQKRIG